MLYRRGPHVRKPQPRVDSLLANIAYPVVLLEEGKMVNLITLSIDGSALRGIVLALVPALGQ